MSGVDEAEATPAEADAAPEPPRISRRAAIGIIGASAALGVLGTAIVRRDPGGEPTLVQPGGAAAGDTGSTGGLAAIGQAYLAAVPEESDQAALLAGLGVAEDAVGDPNAMLDALADQVHADFAAGDTIQLDGWALSLTEARLCALIALQDQEG